MASGTERQHPDSSPARQLAEAITGAARDGLVSAYLFGSLERLDAHRESDVDVGVLFSWGELPSRRDRFETALLLAGPIESALGRRADVVVLNDAPPLLAREIVTRGRRVLCADDEADHAFVRDIQLRAADVAPFLERARRVKLSDLAE